jgi:hypothetical protein
VTAWGCASLSPRRTGDADFQRPALLKTLASDLRRFRKKRQPQLLQVLYHDTPFGGRNGRWLRRCKCWIRRPRMYQSISQ